MHEKLFAEVADLGRRLELAKFTLCNPPAEELSGKPIPEADRVTVQLSRVAMMLRDVGRSAVHLSIRVAEGEFDAR